MALNNDAWELDQNLEGSSMHKYKGCQMFIKSRSMKEIASDSWQSTVKRLSSYMNVEDYIDARDTLGSYQFKIEQELV